jgi:2-keto-3-deoxy-L-rhamnonate aldolase RhmA
MSRPSLEDLLAAPRAVGTWVKLPTPTSLEILALGGFDFVILDMEHAPLTLERVHELIGVAHGRGIPALVRVPDHGSSLIGRILDADADGVVVPHVESAEEARALVQAARFAPLGTRGYGPTVRAGDWGSSPSDYRATSAAAVIIPQLESPLGVAAAAEISEVEGLASLFVGPVDLAVTSGLRADSAELASMVEAVVRTARSRGIPVGTATVTEPSSTDADFDWLVASNDASLLLSAASAVATRFHARRTDPRD